MKRLLAAIFLIAAGCWLVMLLTGQMRQRPLVVKLGYPADVKVLKAVSGDHLYLVAEAQVLKVLFYFGGLVDLWGRQISMSPEYFNMFKSLETAIRLDPYNEDAYYFVQGVFTWDVGRPRDVNRLLEYGMRYRTWDAMLPFFAGFNAGYFLHDYDKAAKYMQLAAELSGNPGMAKLASRYYFEAGRVEVALRFLDQMIISAPTSSEAEQYRIRKQSLLAIEKLRTAVKDYRGKFGKVPDDLSQLVLTGILAEIPRDPYGGRFEIDARGGISTVKTFPGQHDKNSIGKDEHGSSD